MRHETSVISEAGAEGWSQNVQFERFAPFESPFAPSAVSTFTTNFLLVTVDKCYVKIAHTTSKKDAELVDPTAPRSIYK
jgi:hypothetical protein